MKNIARLILLSTGNGLFLNACNSEREISVKQPNILIAITDDQSFAHTSFAGARFVNTPGFDRVARNGRYFSNCYASSPGSAPSRGSLVTGRHHWQNEQSGQHASSWMNKYVPFVDVLTDNGYHSGFTGKGVGPFRYARSETDDSLWRSEDAAGKAYNDYRYTKDFLLESGVADGIELINYYENFRHFMQQRQEDQPFYFWYGAQEPHRPYEKDAWIHSEKNIEQVDVPGFLPDNEAIRKDMLDYAVEIEWTDMHLNKMLNYLDSIGELDNTIVIVTSDNGMSFPGAKASCFDYGIHVPMAISYPNKFPAGKYSSDLISFIDIAPTLLEMAGITPEKMMPISGKSIVNILQSEKSGTVDKSKRNIFAGRERHSFSRWENLGYPQRTIRNSKYLFIWNMKPERWPAGDPQALNKDTNELYPIYGVDQDGIHNSEWAFTDVDASPSKSFLVENHNNPSIRPYFDLAFAKRTEFELYDIENDPFCLNNLTDNSKYSRIKRKMKKELLKELEKSEDPRIVGPDKEIFESYIRYSGPMRKFPEH